ncbi:MAG: hypothetical protein LBL59_06310 [Xanthomonadaceae bacterium]|nr:hypothetical protein [Xanthomonadaceae bacterium]
MLIGIGQVMARCKNTVENRLEYLGGLWMQATGETEAKLLVWRPHGNAMRMLEAFFEAQKNPGDWSVPDLFLNLRVDFETSYRFSRELKESLRLSYEASRASFIEEGAQDWEDAGDSYPDTAAGVMALLDSFAHHHDEFFRYLVLVVNPAKVRSEAALEHWIESAVLASGRVRLCLLDDVEGGRWQPLVERFGALARVIVPDIDIFDIARNTAVQSGGAGSATGYRMMLADIMTTLEKGNAAQVAERAGHALRVAEKQAWPDQQVALHMMVAGAYMKERKFAEAIARYRTGHGLAVHAMEQGHPVGSNLVMQACFGEAGAWLAAEQWERAADAYRQASQAAGAVPNAMFVIEGLRMAAFCNHRLRRDDLAREDLLYAVVEGKRMATEDRKTTTFPVALQDLMRLQDPRRTARLEKLAGEYQKRLASAHAGAESKAVKLGSAPERRWLEKIDADLLADCEAAFERLCREREHLIAASDGFFRKVVAVARELLHPQWNGLPEVRHPLDKTVEEWSSPPAFAVAPDASALPEVNPAMQASSEQGVTA